MRPALMMVMLAAVILSAAPVLAAPPVAGTPTVAPPFSLPTPPLVTPTPALQTFDCGHDLDCMGRAASTCRPTTVEVKLSFDLFGMVATATTVYQTRGMQDGRCVLYQRTRDATVELTEEMAEGMRAEGATEEDIATTAQRADDSMQQMIGLARTCRFDPQELAEMFGRWAAGSFSTADDVNAQCTPLVRE